MIIIDTPKISLSTIHYIKENNKNDLEIIT